MIVVRMCFLLSTGAIADHIGSRLTLFHLVAPNQRGPICQTLGGHEPAGSYGGQFVAHCSSNRYRSVISHSSHEVRRDPN
jgi:hypothetical protein